MASNVSTPQPPQINQLTIAEFLASLESDDSATLAQLTTTHTPDGRKVDVKKMLPTIANILRHVNPRIIDGPSGTYDEALKSARGGSDDNLKSQLASIINKVSCKMACSSGGVIATTMALLKKLSKYSWDAKVVLTMAAFAVNYGELGLFNVLYTKEDPLALSVAVLKQLPDIKKHTKLLGSRSTAIVELLRAIMLIIKSIVELLDQLATVAMPTDMDLIISKAACWTIYSVVICASRIARLNEYQISFVESGDLERLVIKSRVIQANLNEKLTYCQEQIETYNKNYRLLLKLFGMSHTDNMAILEALFRYKDGTQQLVIGNKKDEKIGIEVLKGKYVLLLISGLDLTKEEITTLTKFYKDGQEKYQIVWLPVMDKLTLWEDKNNVAKFEKLQQLMQWYTVQDPAKIRTEVIRFIQEKWWHFTKRMVLVPIDSKGEVQSLNAVDMLWIWGNLAFPFTDEKEEWLWEDHNTWTVDLLLGDINQTILTWTKQSETIVCLYGGDDIEWIRKFTDAAKIVEKNISVKGINLKLVYVGKRNAIKHVEEINQIIDSIGDLNLNCYWADPATSIWFFWTRLDTILRSKMQRRKNVDNEIMRGVTNLLTFDGTYRGSWVLFCHGPSAIANAKGDVVLPLMKDKFDTWGPNVDSPDNFLPELSKNIPKPEKEHCYHLTIPGDSGDIPEMVVCAECGRTMEKYLMYRCCVEE